MSTPYEEEELRDIETKLFFFPLSASDVAVTVIWDSEPYLQ